MDIHIQACRTIYMYSVHYNLTFINTTFIIRKQIDLDTNGVYYIVFAFTVIYKLLA